MASVVISGDTSGTATLQAQAIAGNTTLTLPTASGTLITTASGQTLTSPTITTPTITTPVINSATFNPSGSAPIYAARAWGRFNGTGSNGNQSITGSANVTSVNKTGTGSYTVTLSTAMPDANYCVVATAAFGESTSACSVSISSITTTTFIISTHRTDVDTPNLANTGLCSFIVMG